MICLDKLDNCLWFQSGNAFLAGLGITFLWLLVYWGYKLGKRAEKRNAKCNTGNKLNAIIKTIEDHDLEERYKLFSVYAIAGGKQKRKKKK